VTLLYAVMVLSPDCTQLSGVHKRASDLVSVNSLIYHLLIYHTFCLFKNTT